MALLSSHLLLRTYSLTLFTVCYYLVFSPSKLLHATPVWLLGESMSIRPAEYAHEPDTLIQQQQPPSSFPILPGSRQRNAPVGGFRAPGLAGSAAASFPPLLNSNANGETQSELELFALLALVVAVYALLQLVFAGDLAVLPPPPTTTTQSPPSSSSIVSKNQQRQRQRQQQSSRYAEELHTLFTAQSRWLTLSGVRMLGSAALVAWIYVFHSHRAALTSSSSSSAAAAVTAGFSLLTTRVTFTVALFDMLFWGYLWTVLKDEGRQVAANVAKWRGDAEDQEED